MRLIGYVDGVMVIFTFSPPNQFIAEVPNKARGIYIVELHLIGDNYTQTNLTKALVGIDFRKLQMKFLPLEYSNLVGKLEEEYEEEYLNFKSYDRINIENNVYFENILENIKFKINDSINEYSFNIIEGNDKYSEKAFDNKKFKTKENLKQYNCDIITKGIDELWL